MRANPLLKSALLAFATAIVVQPGTAQSHFASDWRVYDWRPGLVKLVDAGSIRRDEKGVKLQLLTAGFYFQRSTPYSYLDDLRIECGEARSKNLGYLKALPGWPVKLDGAGRFFAVEDDPLAALRPTFCDPAAAARLRRVDLKGAAQAWLRKDPNPPSSPQSRATSTGARSLSPNSGSFSPVESPPDSLRSNVAQALLANDCQRAMEIALRSRDRSLTDEVRVACR